VRPAPRWFLPITVGILTFGFVWTGRPGFHTDFDTIYAGGLAVSRGLDPYAYVQSEIAAGRLYSPYYYPATAAVLTAPLGLMSRQLAAALFTALGMTLLAFSVSGWRQWILVSPPAIQAVIFGQWSPWLTAAIGLPWLGFVWAAKPNMGAALFASGMGTNYEITKLRNIVIGGLPLIVLSLLLMPGWPVDWLEAVQVAPQYRSPVMRAGGFLLLLAFLKWREPEARLLGLLATIPHTTTFYEQIPLLLIPKTKRAFGWLMASFWLVAVWGRFLMDVSDFPTTEALKAQAILDRQWPYFLVFVYLPCLWIVLRQPSAVSAPLPAEPSTPPLVSRVGGAA
jgi:hypothetical protein